MNMTWAETLSLFNKPNDAIRAVNNADATQSIADLCFEQGLRQTGEYWAKITKGDRGFEP